MIASLLQRNLLFVSGKGGTGKTSLAAALAYEAAGAGKKVLLVESAQQEQLAPLFGIASVGHKETRLAPNLWGINLAPTECLREYVVERIKMPRLYEKVFQNGLVKTFLEAIPGLAETMILGRLQYTCLKAPYDLVIYDAPASGHFLGLMTTLDAILASGLVGPLLDQVREVKRFLADPDRCGILFVALAEDLVVSETLDFLPRLRQESPTPVMAVAINRALPWESSLAALARVKDTALRAFLEEKLRRNVACQEQLQEALAAQQFPANRVLRFPDCGSLPEPLTLDFVRKWIYAAQTAFTA